MTELSTENPISFTFPKKEKLKNKKLFEQLFTEGKSITAFPVKLLYTKADFDGDIRIKVGVVAPKKKFRSAVKRSKVKRLLREGYRLNKHLVFNNIEGNFAFLFLYLGGKMPNYKEVDKAMKQLLEAFQKKTIP
ncbi:ribonuclease P protein component [Flagellimonas sp. CMM7]|uniref:ribonuclease P protein component n=1 Tax=Flagellimonas sp. CMM7 TaxID=2654676 RepID=UPI0013D20E0C|nr:ribonuclease P protein component [Flagellimonas sp. CMM7]UII81618.1 ribonuclease P protein component [Flagellimonas sp. CMM7]